MGGGVCPEGDGHENQAGVLPSLRLSFICATVTGMKTNKSNPADVEEIIDEEPHLTEMDRQAETREADDGYWD